MCNNPYIKTISNGTRTRYIKLPCGNCLGCRIDRLNQWKSRCEYEAQKRKNAFVTITYDDLHLQFNEGAKLPTLKKAEIIKYIQRIYRRKERQFNKKPDFKYFCSGEYGGKLMRPHAHIVFFGLDFAEDRHILQDTWKNGMTKILPLQRGGIRYVVDYFTKEMCNGQLAYEKFDNRGLERPFITHSQGLGRDLYLNNKEQIQNTGKVTIGGKSYPVPIYYKQLLTDYTDAQCYNLTTAEHKEKIRMKQRANNAGFNNIEEYEEFIHKNNERELLEKMRNKGTIIDDRLLYI